MRKIILLLSIFMLVPCLASASFGTGIGITFPASGSSSSAGSTNTYAAVTFDNISEELTLEEKHGRLVIELKISNTGDAPYTINHRTGQKYDFLITDKNGLKLWQWSDNMAFTQALTTVTIKPHEFAVYQAELDSKDYRKIKDKAVLLTAYALDTPCKLSAKLPTRIAASSTPVMIHGGVIFGNGRLADD